MRPPPEYDLRSARDADGEFCWRMHLEAFGALLRTDEDWDEHAAAHTFLSLFDPAGYQIIVLAGEDAGMLSCERAGDQLLVRCLALCAERRGLGVGAAVLRDLLREARSAGRRLRIDLRAGDWRLRTFCERVGLGLEELPDGGWRMLG